MSYVVSIVSLQLVTNLYNLTDGAAEKQGGAVKKQEGKRLWVCGICNKELTSRSGYNGHVKAHDKSVIHQCDVCDKVLSTQSALIRHKKIHSGVKSYECETCGEAFYRKDNLNVHRLKHTDVKPHKCTICPDNRSFKTKAELKEHMKHHYPPKYSCKLCDRKFHTSSNLSRHKTSHRDEKPHKCQICPDNRYFKTKAQLNVHKKYHYAPEYVCKICDKNFYTSKCLSRHKTRHRHKKMMKSLLSASFATMKGSSNQRTK